MRRRYDLRRSDNYTYTGKVSYVCSGDGTVKVWTGFPVTSATVAFATIPWPDIDRGYSSSSSSSSSESMSMSSSSESSLTSEEPYPVYELLPRLYVSSYDTDGFYVTYENIPPDIGFIEFNYSSS